MLKRVGARIGLGRQCVALAVAATPAAAATRCRRAANR